MQNSFQHLLGAPAPLKGKFIMDRNLGARDTKRAIDGKGLLLYPFGRKDSFGTIFNSSHSTNAYLGRSNNVWSFASLSGTTTIANAVNNPMTYFFPGSGANWCEAVDSTTYLWQDYECDAESGGKSIFDPSPYGWKVPHIDTWSNFTIDTMTDWDANYDTLGRSYPRGDNPFAYYPVHGFRYASNGNHNEIAKSAAYWSSTPISASGGCRFLAQDETVLSKSSQGRGGALPIRPVQHNE